LASKSLNQSGLGTGDADCTARTFAAEIDGGAAAANAGADATFAEIQVNTR
jgi:hypothetical protein